MKFAVVVLLVAMVTPALMAKLPSYVKACKRNDPNLNDCAFKHALQAIPRLIKGDPEYDIPKLDPLVVDKIVIGDGKQGSGLGITFSCEKCKIHGLKDIQPKSVKFNLKKQQIELNGDVPQVEIEGKYKASGKVLILPIEGEGDADLKLTNVNLDYKADFDLKKGKDGKDYIHIKNPKLNIKSNGFSIQLTNLFKGDKNLGNQMNVFLNENSKDVLRAFGPSVADSLSVIVTAIVNRIAGKVPYDEVFPK